MCSAGVHLLDIARSVQSVGVFFRLVVRRLDGGGVCAKNRIIVNHVWRDAVPPVRNNAHMCVYFIVELAHNNKPAYTHIP